MLLCPAKLASTNTETPCEANDVRKVLRQEWLLAPFIPARLKAWWFTAESGKLAICVRYGARQLELGKGKFSVEVPSPAELVPTLEIIKAAIEAGELDTQLEATAGSVRNGFHR